MADKQLMKTIEREFILEAAAGSREAFFGTIFTKLKKLVYQEVKGVILHLEPSAVYLLEEDETFYTEKFLGLFMPRRKTSFTGEAKVVVVIKYIE